MVVPQKNGTIFASIKYAGRPEGFSPEALELSCSLALLLFWGAPWGFILLALDFG
jgi:hypothetical protein